MPKCYQPVDNFLTNNASDRTATTTITTIMTTMTTITFHCCLTDRFFRVLPVGLDPWQVNSVEYLALVFTGRMLIVFEVNL